MAIIAPARKTVNVASFISQVLTDPNPPENHFYIALSWREESYGCYDEFSCPPPGPADALTIAAREARGIFHPAKIARFTTLAPAPVEPVKSAWDQLDATTKNNRVMIACEIMFKAHPADMPRGQVAAATKTAQALTGDPARTDVLPRIRAAWQAALTPAPVVTESVAEPAPVQTDEPASSPLPSVMFSSPVIQAGRNSIVLILDGLDGTEMDAVSSAYHARFVPGIPAADQTEAQSAARARLPPVRRCSRGRVCLDRSRT